MRAGALEPALALAFQPSAVDVVEAFAPPGDKLRDQLGWVLAVGIEDQRGPRVDLVEASGQCRLLAEIARQPQQRHPRLARGDLLQHAPRRIVTAVVDVQHTAVDIGQPVEAGGDARMQQRQAGGLVEGGDDDGQAVWVHVDIVTGSGGLLALRPLIQ